jgi:glutamate-1-semialdehyde 2,1-aminomutase
MGVVPAEPGFLEFLREAATAAGALLVFDEVISGFRAPAPSVVPDLVVLGKIIGGGLPLAAYAGRSDLMGLVAPAGAVYQAGTLSGNPLATAAGLATLALLTPDAYERLEATTRALAEGLAGLDDRINVTWRRGLLTVFFTESPPRDYAGAQAASAEAYAAFCRAMLERGIYPPASQFEAWFPSLAHTEEHVEQTIEAAKQALSGL